MKRLMITLLMVFIALVLGYGNADAVTGQCSNCHTMHDSQGGADQGDSNAQEYLLKAGCVTCHMGPHDTNGRNAAYSAPVVLDTVNPGATAQGGTDTLAGGDFYWVDAGSDAKGHNVADLPTSGAADATLGTTPPGWDQTATSSAPNIDGKTINVTGSAGWGGAQLTCAGTFGCHGTREAAGFAGLTGAHHGNAGTDDVASTADTVANSYRFLAGIKGLEHVNHNYNEAAATHNEYLGDNDTSTERDDDGTNTYANTDSINFFCAQCHGDFHAAIDSDATFGNPWVRHPTDIVLPNEAPFTEYNNDGGGSMGNYNLVVPVARGAVPAASSATVLNNDATDTGGIVMCLSCHRAHGSPYDDMLRFDYTAMTVGGASTTGCMVCHTDKN